MKVLGLLPGRKFFLSPNIQNSCRHLSSNSDGFHVRCIISPIKSTYSGPVSHKISDKCIE